MEGAGRGAHLMPFGVNPQTGRPGPSPMPPRDGDRVQARQRINVEVRMGRRPRPNALPCSDCGHVWKKGEQRHEYDHYLGYAPEHHCDVEAVCKRCHVLRDNLKAKQTHCKHGHAFTAENTYRKSNGTRACRQCMRRWDRHRGPRGSEYWQQVNARRKGKNYGKQ